MKWEYMLVLAAVALFPLILSADRKLGIYTNRLALAATLITVCIPYWIWDVIATERGHWSFHPERTLGAVILGMPIEEWLFFPVLVFVSVFTWESTKYFLGRKQ